MRKEREFVYRETLFLATPSFALLGYHFVEVKAKN